MPSSTKTKAKQDAITPSEALELLKAGNQRFVAGNMVERDLMEQVAQTGTGQYPFATILHCVDSRVSAELIFDQGVGDIFSVRIAGNFVNQDILGSMEFASRLAGSKCIVVLGHTSCGAIKGACDGAVLGNLTSLLEKLEPAVDAVEHPDDEAQRTSKNSEFVNQVARKNVELTMRRITRKSKVLRAMVEMDEVLIVGGMYDVQTGTIDWLA
ncbi:MAG: carbonic anhydrase family protein [Nonlabens sp.]